MNYEKLLTYLNQSRRDYTLWATLLKFTIGQDAQSMLTSPVASSEHVTLNSSTLRLQDQNARDVGLGVQLTTTAAQLDDLWFRTNGMRSQSASAHPFVDWAADNGGKVDIMQGGQTKQLGRDTYIKHAVAIACLLFGVVPAESGDSVFTRITGVDLTADMRVTIACFLYNILIGAEEERFIEPCYNEGDFWLRFGAADTPHRADLGLCWFASQNQSRWRTVVSALNELFQQVSLESWTSSALSYLAAQQMQAGDVQLTTWMLLGRAILVSSPMLAARYNLEAKVLNAMSPYEDPVEFLEYAVTGSAVPRIEQLAQNDILRMGVMGYRTPLTQGCLPPFAVFQWSWDKDSNKIEAVYLDYDQIAKASPTCAIAIDIRGLLKGGHTEVPFDRLPEVFTLALMSLLIGTPFMQNLVSCTTDATLVLEQLFPGLAGKFARRDVEWTFRHAGQWWFKDQAPVVHEMGTKAWLFDNHGLSLSPRAFTGSFSGMFNILPDTITCRNVTLTKQGSVDAGIAYRRTV